MSDPAEAEDSTGQQQQQQESHEHHVRMADVAVTITTETSMGSPSPAARHHRTVSPHSTPSVQLASPNGPKVLRNQASKLSHHSHISHWSYISEAMTEVAEGLEPLWAYCTRLVQHHRRLLAGSILLVSLGVAGGMAIEGWSFLTSLYVIVQISTTIGYGDVTVDRDWMKLFMTFYVLASLFVLANFVQVMLTTIIHRHCHMMHNQLVKMEVIAYSNIENEREARKRLGRFNEVFVSGVLFALAIIVGTVFYRTIESCTCSYGTSQEDFGLESCDDRSYETCALTGGLEHTWITAFYMSVITVTTVGFGDYTPKSVAGRIFGILWMMLGVAATGLFITAVSQVIAKDPDVEIHTPDSIDENLFRSMDKDGNGYLTKAEFTRYVLVRQNFLPMDVLREIDEKFDMMDLSRRGKVTFDQVQQAAKHLTES